MQIKIFSIPIVGGEAVNEDMNAFLRSKKVIQTEQRLVGEGDGALWSFCIKYVEDYSPFIKGGKGKVDYREVLDAASFEQFSRFREIRKKLAVEENAPAFTIFTDEELAELSKMEEVTLSNMRAVKGIGDKKAEKYGQHFITKK
jgi:superfamily II DNA helicase RecQ